MAQANVNSSDLLQTLRYIQTGSRSVEATCVMIKTRYQQIGADWNDKKYKELGDVLQDCYRALNDLQKILLQMEKYILLLVTCIQEYDTISLNSSGQQGIVGFGTNAINQFVPTVQSTHKDLLVSREDKLSGVISDIKAGSNKEITIGQANQMLDGIDSYSGDGYSLIRYAYNNPSAPESLRSKLEIIDYYLHNAPKWKGVVFRGINISRTTAQQILNQGVVDMLGPSSWSSNESVAQRFSTGDESVNMVFVLRENRSGASITHIARYNGSEEEVLAPSRTLYEIDSVRQADINGQRYVYVDVHENAQL